MNWSKTDNYHNCCIMNAYDEYEYRRKHVALVSQCIRSILSHTTDCKIQKGSVKPKDRRHNTGNHEGHER